MDNIFEMLHPRQSAPVDPRYTKAVGEAARATAEGQVAGGMTTAELTTKQAQAGVAPQLERSKLGEQMAKEKKAKLEAAGKFLPSEKYKELQDEKLSIETFEGELNSQITDFYRNFARQGLGTVRELLPESIGPIPISSINQTYNARSMRMVPYVAKLMGFTSKQMDTPAELKRVETFVPKSDDSDQSAAAKLLKLKEMVDAKKKLLDAQLQHYSAGDESESK